MPTDLFGFNPALRQQLWDRLQQENRDASQRATQNDEVFPKSLEPTTAQKLQQIRERPLEGPDSPILTTPPGQISQTASRGVEPHPLQTLADWWRSVRGSHELQHSLPPLDTFTVERALTGALGVGPVLDWAQQRPSELGYPDSLGEEKALRHLLLSAELHRTSPRLADPLLYGHEYLSNVLHGQSLDNRYKDLYNNSLGKFIGQRSTSRQQVEDWARAAMPQANTRDYSLSDYQSRVPPPDQPGR